MSNNAPWRILVVDDEEGIHGITRMIFRGYRFENRPIELVSALSGEEARTLLLQHDDICLALLDVVMESDDEGLRLINFIRDQLNNSDMRIILRTGHPGFAPETDVIVRYDINDYLSKADLSAARLLTSVVVALRSWRDIQRAKGHAAPEPSLTTQAANLAQPLIEPILLTNQQQLQRLGQMALSPMALDLVAELRANQIRLAGLLQEPAGGHIGETDITSLLDQSLHDLLPYARQQRRLFDYQLAEGMPNRLRLDATAVQTLWQSLLLHALAGQHGPDLRLYLTYDQAQLTLRIEGSAETPGQEPPSYRDWWLQEGLPRIEQQLNAMGGQLQRLADDPRQIHFELRLQAPQADAA